MTSTDIPRLLRLERRVRQGDTLTPREAWDLEQLRDQMGQLDALPQHPSGPWRDPDIAAIDRDDLHRLAHAPLIGHDHGEQADLFGQTILL